MLHGACVTARLQPELVDSGREKFTRYVFELAIRTSDVPAASADDVRAACAMLHATSHVVRRATCRAPRVPRCVATHGGLRRAGARGVHLEALLGAARAPCADRPRVGAAGADDRTICAIPLTATTCTDLWVLKSGSDLRVLRSCSDLRVLKSGSDLRVLRS
jgi:hypothetical protein